MLPLLQPVPPSYGTAVQAGQISLSLQCLQQVLSNTISRLPCMCFWPYKYSRPHVLYWMLGISLWIVLISMPSNIPTFLFALLAITFHAKKLFLHMTGHLGLGHACLLGKALLQDVALQMFCIVLCLAWCTEVLVCVKVFRCSAGHAWCHSSTNWKWKHRSGNTAVGTQVIPMPSCKHWPDFWMA